MKRFLIILAILAIGMANVGCGSLPGTSASTTKTTAQQTATVQRGSIVATVSAAGNVTAPEDASLTFSSSGRVAKVNVQIGDKVKAGQVLMEQDLTDLNLSLRTVQAQLSSSQANLESAKAKNAQNVNQLIVAKLQVDKAAVALQKAQADYNNIAWRGDVSSTTQATTLASATADYQNALANYQITASGINDTALRQAQATVDKDQISIEQAQRNIEKAKIVAPFDGVVAQVNFSVGDTAGTGIAVLVIDNSKLQVKPNVAEVDVEKIKAGQSVQMTFDALPSKTYEGKVISVAPQATILQGVVNFPVTIEVSDKSGEVKPGMTANATIQIERRDNVLIAPSRAIRTQGTQRTATVLYKGQSILVPVTIGFTGDQTVEIMSGLQEGDVLVIGTTQTSTGGGGALGGFGGGGGGGGPVIIQGGGR